MDNKSVGELLASRHNLDKFYDGENGAKLDPLAAPPGDETQNQGDENESEDESESGKENEDSAPNSPREDGNRSRDLTPPRASSTPETPRTPTKIETEVPISPTTSRQNDEPKWRSPLNGLVKMETEIMDLSSKRRRLASDDSEPETKIPRRASPLKRDESQPLDLSQKSSRIMDSPPRRPFTPPSTSQPLPISPSLASLQKKFGCQTTKPVVDHLPRPKSPPVVSSQARMWYSNVYRQTMAPYSLYQPKIPYYPLPADVPLHATYPALAAAAVGLMPDLSALKSKSTPQVSMTTKTQQPSINSQKHKSLLPKSSPTNGTPHSPMTSPRGPLTSLTAPPLNFEQLKDAKSNCIDFKCDCGKTYSTLYELSVHMQDTGHMPRNTKAGPSGDYPKLVRGQDMWLNNGLEQTKQILRCMHCGESFKTLPELTVHMMKTQHYADIFSSAHRKMHKCTTFFEKENDTKSVFKCRVCETEYDSLDSLANHMVESRHHKRSNSRTMDDPIKVRQSILATMAGEDCDSHSDGTPPLVSPNVNVKLAASHDRSRDQDDVIGQSTSSSNDVKDVKNDIPSAQNGDVNHNTDKDSRSGMTSPATSDNDVKPTLTLTNGRDTPVSDNEEEEHNIKCENCFERIKTDLFVEHVRHCISKERKHSQPQPPPPQENVKPIVTSLPSPPPLERVERPKSGGSALKAMEQFIENFNERKTHKAAAPMSSLLYDYVGPLGGVQKAVNGDRRSPVDKMRVSYYEGRGAEGQSALHNLYRFTSYGGHRMPPRDSPSKPGSRSPLPSPKLPSPRSSPMTSRHEHDVPHRSPDVRSEVRHTDVPSRSSDVISRHIDVITSTHNDVSTSRHLDVGRQNDVISRSSDVSSRNDDVSMDLKPDQMKSESPASRRHSPTSPQPRTSERGSCSSPGDCGYHSNDMDSEEAKKAKFLQNGRLSPSSNPRTPDSNTEHPPNGKTSALDSLKGLVDKHMDKSEHPLNSLQKLINQTDGNHSNNVTSLQTRLINVTSSPYWFSFSHVTRGWQQGANKDPMTSQQMTSAERAALAERAAVEENRCVVDSDGVEVKVSDLKCDNCGKLFSSRGGCRYHRSKCIMQQQQQPQNQQQQQPQNKVTGSKEAQIVQTPYTYMPLEHTNKFSKYYEMARELANKSN